MLQYLTDDLLPGYVLPKKRVICDLRYLTFHLRESVITYDSGDGTPSRLALQDADVVAIGGDSHRISCSLHTDATIRYVGFNRGRISLNWDNLHIFLD